MSELFFLASFLLLICSINSQYRFDCYENYCTTKGNECPEFECEDGRTIMNATKCGCCSLCIRSLKEGDACTKVYYHWDNKIAECGHGLICKGTSETEGKCVPSKCLERIRKYQEEYSTDKPRLKVTFECDHFGYFEPSEYDLSKPHVVCINDVLCFCVDKNGKRIFGTDFAKRNSSDMKCDCSRDINDFPEKVDFERLPRCLSNGDYDPLQCVQKKCFCMESIRHPDDELIDAERMKELTCYDDDRRLQKNRMTRCLKDREEERERFSDKNMFLIGFDYTRCELDGTYYPMQCKKGRCFCVKRNGDILSGFEDISREQGDLMCRCMRDKEIIHSYEGEKTRNMEIFETIKCNEAYTSDNKVLPKSFVNDFIKH